MKRILLTVLAFLTLFLLCASAFSASAEGDDIPDDALVTFGYLQKELDKLREEIARLQERITESTLPLPRLPASLPRVLSNAV